MPANLYNIKTSPLVPLNTRSSLVSCIQSCSGRYNSPFVILCPFILPFFVMYSSILFLPPITYRQSLLAITSPMTYSEGHKTHASYLSGIPAAQTSLLNLNQLS
ncbi:hypothetical protein L873DRAFT_1295010 [Choiromyces venosus 120613-1]|uniref:Uncharacterized protein n=1 Tax=Choiromyces venosus 120613-1 TaxID=1336337 RepID=A0A3N4JEG5_9PEZI|nr:hypothetical protein L873DRAFT_1295010 [Choiromyces venosus 120613-1]